ncbi:HK97 family phage prohead protease [Luteimonas saliphila]|uniref:HK97 family phage prohead protease n=1 Tax=Luteimonas saliphila TaxID=2804919 RepID=UPI00192DC91B|nr:HK97 family phage prohead protease [Luteimonas saliphila]
MKKAWSLLEVKSVEDDQRIVRGMATTPTVDRVGDVVEPEGVVFRGPVKLHLYHKHDLPVGQVKFGRPTKAGIPFEAHIPDVKEAGTVRERVNEAWHSVKYKLLDAVSIGFGVLEDGVELMRSGGYRFTKWEMLELSLVGVPANPDAVVTAFKSADSRVIRSALGIERAEPEHVESVVKLLSARDMHIKNGAVPLR